MTERKQLECESVHVGDCYVWSEIFYLDSPTNYREWLPRRMSLQSRANRDEFITLDKEAKLLGVLLAIGRSINRRLGRSSV